MKKLMMMLIVASFALTGCSMFGSGKKKTDFGGKKSKKVALAPGQLPDWDYQIHQPLNTEIMIMIDRNGKAKEIPDEWSVDTTAHMPYKSDKVVAKKVKKKPKKRVAKKSKKKKRRPASIKKKRKKRKSN